MRLNINCGLKAGLDNGRSSGQIKSVTFLHSVLNACVDPTLDSKLKGAVLVIEYAVVKSTY